MKALTYIEHGKFALTDKPKPGITVGHAYTGFCTQLHDGLKCSIM